MLIGKEKSMRKFGFVFILLNALVLFPTYCEDSFEIEGLWGSSFYNQNEENPTFLSIEEISDNNYIFIWYNIFHSENMVIGKLSFNNQENHYSGLTTDNDSIVVYEVESLNYAEMISIGFAYTDESYDFIKIDRVLGNLSIWGDK